MARLNKVTQTSLSLDALIQKANDNDQRIRDKQEKIPPAVFLEATISELIKAQYPAASYQDLQNQLTRQFILLDYIFTQLLSRFGNRTALNYALRSQSLGLRTMTKILKIKKHIDERNRQNDKRNSQEIYMPRWTTESRQAQSDKMKQLKPWLKTTGPKTEDGKKASSQNAMKHGMRSEMAKELRQVLRQQAEILKTLL